MKNNKSLAIFILILISICSFSNNQNLIEKESSSINLDKSHVSNVNNSVIIPKQKLKSYLRHSSDSYERKYEIKNIEKYNRNYKLRMNENQYQNQNQNINQNPSQSQNQSMDEKNQINSITQNYLNYKLYLQNIVDEDYYNKCIYEEEIKIVLSKNNEYYKFLFDFLDPIFYNDITTMYEKVGYDFFNNRDLITVDNSEVKMDDLRKIEHSFSHWGWNMIDKDYNTSAVKFLKKYDIDNDNSLNFTEFIKGIIDVHKGKYVLCHNCFHLIKLRLKAIFNVFKCSNKEVMSTTDFKKGLNALENKDLFIKNNIFDYKIDNYDLVDVSILSFYQKYSDNENYITEDDFVTGFLTGYLERLYVDNYSLEDELIEEKSSRWGQLKKN